jgi:hypothetical protein
MLLDKEKLLDILEYSMFQNSRGIFVPKNEDTTASIQYNEPEINPIEAIKEASNAFKLIEEARKRAEEEIFKTIMTTSLLFFTETVRTRPLIMSNFLEIIPPPLNYLTSLRPTWHIKPEPKKKELFLKIFCLKCFKNRKIIKRNFKNKVIKCKKCGCYIKEGQLRNINQKECINDKK